MTHRKENGFFNKLRQLSSDVKSTTNMLKSRVQAPPKEDFSSAAVLKLQQIKKEVKQVKKDSSELLNNFQQKNTDFETLLKTCHNVLEFQRNATVEIEGFLHQYGYTTWTEKELAAKVKNEANQSLDEETNEASTVCKTPQSKPVSPSHRKGTPKLEDFGLSEYTMQALYGIKKETKQAISSTLVKPKIREMVSEQPQETFTARAVQNLADTSPVGKPSHSMLETPQHLKNDEQNYGTPMQSVPAMFVNNGIIVTPMVSADGKLFSMNTPPCHIGGIKGFENSNDHVPMKHKAVLKLETLYLDSSDTQTRSERLERIKKASENNSSDTQTISERLQSIKKASENRNLELFTPSDSGNTLATISCNAPRFGNKGDHSTPPEPEFLSARLTKHLAVSVKSTEFLMKEQSKATDNIMGSVILPKPVDERAYCFSDIPAPPKFLGRYNFMNENSENNCK